MYVFFVVSDWVSICLVHALRARGRVRRSTPSTLPNRCSPSRALSALTLTHTTNKALTLKQTRNSRNLCIIYPSYDRTSFDFDLRFNRASRRSEARPNCFFSIFCFLREILSTQRWSSYLLLSRKQTITTTHIASDRKSLSTSYNAIQKIDIGHCFSILLFTPKSL